MKSGVELGSTDGVPYLLDALYHERETERDSISGF